MRRVLRALLPLLVAVGFDPLEAKYGAKWDGTEVVRAPSYALGAEQVLPDGVRFRRGDVPQSIESIALYAGPAAPPERSREAEGIAAGLRLVTTGDPSLATVSPVPATPAPPTGGWDAASPAPGQAARPR